MTKKNETVVDIPSELAEVEPQTALDFLRERMSEEIKPEASFKLPRLHIYQSGKKYTDSGATRGFVVEKAGSDKIEVNVDSLRLSWLDGPINARVMWPYDDTGKRLTDTNQPICGSSDGLKPREGAMFNFIGNTHIDWRTRKPHTIVADCLHCPLGNDRDWVGLVDANGQPVMDEDPFTHKFKQRTGPPPCQQTPVYIFWDHDRNQALMFQASSTTVRLYSKGSKKWGKRAAIKGFMAYYEGDSPEVFKDNQMFPLWVGSQPVKVDRYNTFVNVPLIRLHDVPLTLDEVNLYGQAKKEYIDQRVRDFVTGTAFTTIDEELLTEAAAPTLNQLF